MELRKTQYRSVWEPIAGPVQAVFQCSLGLKQDLFHVKGNPLVVLSGSNSSFLPHVWIQGGQELWSERSFGKAVFLLT